MLNIWDEHKHLVIPKWLSLPTAVKSRDISVLFSGLKSINQDTIKKLQFQYTDFLFEPSPYIASDLMGAAFIVGENEIAIKTARYILKDSSLPEPTLNLATYIVQGHKQDESKPEIRVLISLYKKSLADFPRDALSWIELGRLYTIKGQLDKAEKAVKTALFLAPFDRYTVRSGVRFFLHSGDYEAALYYAKKAAQQTKDPWLRATEINAALTLSSRHVKLKRSEIKNIPSNQLFHFSELLETIGMLELQSGNKKIAKKDFNLAWVDPSENVITHAEWILREELSTITGPDTLKINNSPEAAAWHNYSINDFNKAIEYTREWELEEPYSKSSYAMCSCLLSCQKKYIDAQKCARRGLDANPRDHLLTNNLCFALLQAGDVEEAEKILNKIGKITEPVENIFYFATKGLLEFKKKNIMQGREYYNKSLDYSNRAKNQILYAKALLHWVLAEIEAKTPEFRQFAIESLKNTIDIQGPDIKWARNEVREAITR